MATKPQLKMIYGVAHKLGIDEDELHGIAFDLTGCETFSGMTPTQAARVIDHLCRVGGIPTERADRATQKQLWLIQKIKDNMGWDDARLRGLLEKVVHVSDCKFLTVKQARKIIESLKAFEVTGRGQDRLRGGVDE